MKTSRNKSKLSTIALILLLTISTILIALPGANAQESVYPYPYINAVPNPVTVNTPTLFHVGSMYPSPMAMAGWSGLTVEVKLPNGETEILPPVDTDQTGGTGVPYTPTMVGTYEVRTHFPEQVKTAADSYTGPAGTIIEDAYSDWLELEVIEEQIPYYPGHSLPEEYWTRPINGQLREWKTIAGHWLETSLPTAAAPPSMSDPMREYNEYAPESGHILFRKQLAMAGLAGGLTEEHGFEQGDAYEPKWDAAVIIGGILFYNQFGSGGGSAVEQEVVAVDLHTGEELWRRPLTTPDGSVHRLSFGQVYYFDSFNYHGVFSYLWATEGGGGFFGGGSTNWHAFDPFSGRWVYSMEDIPSGTRFRGPNGEILQYVVNKNTGEVSLWNSSQVVMAGRSSVFQGSWLWGREGSTFDATSGIEWTVTVPELPDLPGSVYKVRDGIILGSDFSRGNVAPDPSNIWVIAVDNIEGHAELLAHETWSPPVPQISVEDVSVEEDLFIVSTKESRTTYGFRLSTAKQIWGPTPQRHYTDGWGQSSGNSWDIIASGYGKVIAGNYGGTVWCYNAQTGDVEWTFNITDPYTEALHNNLWRFRPSFIADGKLYIENTEHNPRDPQPRGAPIICLNITTGEEIWRLPYRQGEWSSTMIIGDSIVVAQNTYDQHLYAIGRGPSETTVEAPLTAITQESSVMIRGTVMDVSPGTEDPTIAIRFPKGVPAMSDRDMENWMLYVYNQFERPTDVEGVKVFLKIQDPNGDYYSATVTTDENGVFSHMWTPAIAGEYHVTAMFEGSNSYYASQATTTFGVDQATGDIPSANEIADATASRLPACPTASEIADETVNRLPAFLTIDLVILIIVAIGLVIGLIAYMALRKQK
jgi:outer membrane protein assembly factor BamB